MKTTAVRDQDNVHDGTVLVTQEFIDGHLAVTILGRHDVDSEFPTIVVFDTDDLKAIAEAHARMKELGA